VPSYQTVDNGMPVAMTTASCSQFVGNFYKSTGASLTRKPEIADIQGLESNGPGIAFASM
jgi:hypothetical protein